MPTVEVELPDHVTADVQQLVDRGEFLSREQAYEELLSRGIAAYDDPADSEEPIGQDIAEQTFDDQVDPALREDDDAPL